MKINCSGILYRLGNKRTKNDALGKTTIEKTDWGRETSKGGWEGTLKEVRLNVVCQK